MRGEYPQGRCRNLGAGLVGGEGFAVDASLIQADANQHRSIPGTEWNKNIDPDHARRAVKEYLATLDDPANGTASDVTPGRTRCCSACFLSNSSAINRTAGGTPEK